MDRDHLHRGGIRLEPAAALFVVGVLVGIVDAAPEPGRHGGGPETLGHPGLVEQLADVAQVGHEALADGPGQHPAGDVVRAADRLEREATPSSRSRAAQRCRDQWRSSHCSSASRSPPARALHPMKQVRAAERARSRAVGRSSASSRRSHSWAGSVANTRAGAADHSRDAGRLQGVAHDRRMALTRTRTAMWPGCNGVRPISAPSRRRATISAPRDSSRRRRPPGRGR